jgi:hypothetical protein
MTAEKVLVSPTGADHLNPRRQLTGDDDPNRGLGSW